MKIINRTKLIILSLFFASTLFSQTYYFDKYSVKQGLGQSNVYTINQKQNGMLLIGTTAGLSVFNGISFENLTTDNGLAPNGVRSLLVDTNENIWTGHISGGLSFISDDSIRQIILMDSSITGDVTGIVQDDDYNLWIATVGNGAFKLSNPYSKLEEEKLFTQYKGNQGLSDRVFAIAKTKKHGLLYVTDVGVKYYNAEKDTFFSMLDIYEYWPTFFSQTYVFEDSKQNIWVGTYNGGLYKFSNKTDKPFVYDSRDGLAFNWISTVYEDRSGNIWAGTWGGGISKITENDIISYNETNGLPDNKVRIIREDYEGNILIGTSKQGLSIFKGRAFTHYRDFNGTEKIQVNAINKDKLNRFWIASNSGIYLTDENLNKIRKIDKTTEPGLLSEDIRFIVNDRNGHVWIGTFGGGVIAYDIESDKFINPYELNNVVFQAGRGNVTSMVIDENNKLFIGTYDGIIVYDINNFSIDLITQSSGIKGNNIVALYLDSKNRIWVGSRGKGISLINGSKIEHIVDSLKFTPNCFFEDGSKNIWVGSEGIGLIKLNNRKLIKKFTTKDGLFSNMITAITGDENSNVFIGTNLGLNLFDAKDNSIYSFSEKEGFSGIEIKSNSVYKDKTNIYFGTVDGLTKMNINLLKVNKIPPITSITNFKVNLKDRKLEKNLRLNYTENSILFDFHGICLTNPTKVKYKVMLEGADMDWQPITNRTFANYPALSHGEYTFKVLAANNEGVWNEEPTSFSFYIKPPFWKTWWFYSLLVIAIISGIVVYIRIREKRLKMEKAILEQKVKQRTQLIREQNKELNVKNKNITDSINYARRIQRAMMPDQKLIENLGKSSFVFYRPKDIVSGDFFWYSEKDNYKIVVAADCTGHGVPGAFMSMISISALNSIVNEKGITEPGKILDSLRSQIIKDLKQSSGTEETQTKDGLDISLMVIDEENQKISFSGAYNSLYIIKNNAESFEDLSEVKADRMPIGLSAKMDQNFTTHHLNIDTGDRFYIGTDGYIDQFGGPKGKKFMSKRFKKLIFNLDRENSDNSIQELDSEFAKWKGKEEQIDDVLVIGIRY